MKNLITYLLFFTVFIFFFNACNVDNNPVQAEEEHYAGLVEDPDDDNGDDNGDDMDLGNIIFENRDGEVFEIPIEDVVLPDGSTISSRIQDCIDNSRNRWRVIFCVIRSTRGLARNGDITWRQRWRIIRYLLRADIP